MKKLIVEYNMPNYDFLCMPKAFLVNDRACFALWHYFVTSQANQLQQQRQMIYEGDPDPVYNQRQLFRSIAQCYGVQPEQMVNFWTEVNMTRLTLGYTDIPEGWKFRDVPNIKAN